MSHSHTHESCDFCGRPLTDPCFAALMVPGSNPRVHPRVCSIACAERHPSTGVEAWVLAHPHARRVSQRSDMVA